MAYIAPYIDDAGLHIPTYIDIRDDLIEKFKQIYGQDIYLDNDSQDYQMIAAFALKTYDTMQMLQIVYNNHSPKTAVGTALDSIVKLNGIKRKPASYSTCIVQMTGDIGTIINGGIVEDNSGYKWNVPTIKLSQMTQDVTVTCQTIGSIEAVPGSINKIVTPTKGWISVKNIVPAVPGKQVESHEELRARQTISVAIPSQNMLEGTSAGISALDGVKRRKIYENDTSVTDDKGIPGHSICAVVEGGLDQNIAEQIYLRKGPGCGTYGDVLINYINADGLINVIKFFRPTYVGINVSISVKKKNGYTSATASQIKTQIEKYIKGLDIGDSVTSTGVLASILTLIPNLSSPIFSIASLTIGKVGGSLGAGDIDIGFKEIANIGTITVQEVA